MPLPLVSPRPVLLQTALAWHARRSNQITCPGTYAQIKVAKALRKATDLYHAALFNTERWVRAKVAQRAPLAMGATRTI